MDKCHNRILRSTKNMRNSLLPYVVQVWYKYTHHTVYIRFWVRILHNGQRYCTPSIHHIICSKRSSDLAVVHMYISQRERRGLSFE